MKRDRISPKCRCCCYTEIFLQQQKNQVVVCSFVRRLPITRRHKQITGRIVVTAEIIEYGYRLRWTM
jgi:hypothetical protein